MIKIVISKLNWKATGYKDFLKPGFLSRYKIVKFQKPLLSLNLINQSAIKWIKLFAVKCGIAGTAVYFINEEGIWKNSDETVKTYQKIKDQCRPVVTTIKSQLPFEVPQVPQAEEVSTTLKQYWNLGVTTSFHYLIKFPGNVEKWTKQGIHSLSNNPDVNKFLDSFSAQQPEVKDDKLKKK